MAGLWPLFASASFWLGTWAQTTGAICIESYAWAYNSYGQSPCMVAAYLQQQCTGAPVNIPALRQNTLYAVPTSNATNGSCECSSVVYSLMSACASCQLGNYVSWSAWSKNCTTVYMNVFPKVVPVETDVPGWAYNFDLAVAFIFVRLLTN
ncbi:hypothetical protein BDZ94DRAFT_1243944 [Collybia nuda]|uniref:Secreted protein n=1 Tax=Collybia nuda TaxID=64659 RepID=A0A9P5YH61_9AGAR|nr:hypothetical protein BDZ94DRAFT_1243944 [Collybia nuda]